MNREILSVPEAAKYCAVSRWTLWRHIRSGDLRVSRTPGGHYRVSRKDLDVFIRKNGIHPLTRDHAEGTRVLVVDDDPAVRNLLTRVLSDHGYRAEGAADGFDAGVKIVSFRPDVMLLDLIMPGMDGFEVCRRIKKDPETSHIKILALTGYDTVENREKIMAAGADGYATKPLDLSLLLQQTAALLNEKECTLSA